MGCREDVQQKNEVKDLWGVESQECYNQSDERCCNISTYSLYSHPFFQAVGELLSNDSKLPRQSTSVTIAFTIKQQYLSMREFGGRFDCFFCISCWESVSTRHLRVIFLKI